VPYRSKLIEFLAGNTEALDRLVVEMYARGLSTRDIEDAFRGPDGELLLSRTAVSEITDRLWEDYQEFCARDLSEIDVSYLFVDAIFESLRRYGAKEAVLACWCITASGHKVLLHLAVGNKESEPCWTEFFRGMIARGLRVPTSVTADGAPGLINAIGVCFRHSIRSGAGSTGWATSWPRSPRRPRPSSPRTCVLCATPRRPSRDVPPRPIS